MNKLVDAVNGVSTFFTSIYDGILGVFSFIGSAFDFISFSIKTLFTLINSLF